MPVPIFDQSVTIQKKEAPKPEKERISGFVMFLSFILIASIMVMGEFAFRDSNRLLNPYAKSCQNTKQTATQFLSGAKPKHIPNDCDLEKYERARLIIHADIAVPILLIGLIIYFFTRRRKKQGAARVLYVSGMIFWMWIGVRLVFETELYFIKHHPLIGKYIVFGSIVIVVSILIIYIQRIMRKKAHLALAQK